MQAAHFGVIPWNLALEGAELPQLHPDTLTEQTPQGMRYPALHHHNLSSAITALGRTLVCDSMLSSVKWQ